MTSRVQQKRCKLTYKSCAQAVIKRVVPYIEMEEFHPESVAKVSKACKSICQWVRAMYVYHNVALQVEPKRQALAAAQAELDETNRALAAAQAQLAEVQRSIATLEAAFGEATAKKAGLAQQVADCEAKLLRADKLIGGLGGEKARPLACCLRCALRLHLCRSQGLRVRIWNVPVYACWRTLRRLCVRRRGGRRRWRSSATL